MHMLSLFENWSAAGIRILLLGTALFQIGCGGSETGPELGQVAGVVTLDGEPLENAVVTFSPLEETGRSSLGVTDKSGKYQLDYTLDQKGAVLGEHTVTITTQQDAFFDESGAGNDIPARKEILPARYHVKSELTGTVQSGSNTIDFKLESQ